MKKDIALISLFWLFSIFLSSCEKFRNYPFATDLYTPAFQINNLSGQEIKQAIISITDQEYESVKADTIEACSFSTIESNTLSLTKTVNLKKVSVTGAGYFHVKIVFSSSNKPLVLEKFWRYSKFNAKDFDDVYAGGYNTFLIKVVKENGEYKIIPEFLKM